MKRLLIGDSREGLLSTLEVILKHWGYRVLVTSRPDEMIAFIKASSPDLLIIGGSLLTEKQDSPLWQAVADRVGNGIKCPLIILGGTEPQQLTAIPHENLAVPIDIFALFALIQRHLKKIPRQNLRLDLHLPGMLCFNGTCQLTQVLSISRHGVFIKTGFRPGKGDRLKVVIPLIGMKKELEIEGRVLYRVSPDPENNYLQGVGIEFTEIGEETGKILEAFIEKRLFGEISERERTFPGLEKEQLQDRAEATLHLMYPAPP